MTKQADAQQLIAQAIDAKCRLKDNYQMFCCLDKALQLSPVDLKLQSALTFLFWSDSSDAIDFLMFLVSASE